MENITEPLAWLIRTTRGGKVSLECGKMFKSKETAEAAAERMTNRWRKCEAIPVVEMEGAA